MVFKSISNQVRRNPFQTKLEEILRFTNFHPDISDSENVRSNAKFARGIATREWGSDRRKREADAREWGREWADVSESEQTADVRESGKGRADVTNRQTDRDVKFGSKVGQISSKW